MPAFDRFLQLPTEATAPETVTSKFANERMKDTTVHPVNTTAP